MFQSKKTPNKSKATVAKLKSEARESASKSKAPKISNKLDIESDEELPFPFGTPDHGGYKVCINIVYLYFVSILFH